MVSKADYARRLASIICNGYIKVDYCQIVPWRNRILGSCGPGQPDQFQPYEPQEPDDGQLDQEDVHEVVDAQGGGSQGDPGCSQGPGEVLKWFGQYRDADGRWKRAPEHRQDGRSADARRDLEKQVERGKVGLVDPFAGHREAPIASHVEATSPPAEQGRSPDHLAETMRRLRAVLEGCRVGLLADIRLEPVEHFLAVPGGVGAGPRTRNTYRSSIKAFVKWCIRTRRMGEDVSRPWPRLGRGSTSAAGADRGGDRAAAPGHGRAPLAEALTIRRGKRKGQRLARVRPEVQAELERLGRERALMYKTLVLTGLRRGELEALEVRHLVLEGEKPHLRLPGSATKNRKEARLRCIPTLAEDLVEWVRGTGKKGTDRVFVVPGRTDQDTRATSHSPASLTETSRGGRSTSTPSATRTATYLNKNRGPAPRRPGIPAAQQHRVDDAALHRHRRARRPGGHRRPARLAANHGRGPDEPPRNDLAWSEAHGCGKPGRANTTRHAARPHVHPIDPVAFHT